ncbi:TonB-dependent receptor [Granulicella tundricola]|uniref:TonB-dependent receptor plug n=1 Tax=Granulicella tundricola (strain ATCC BAA-1859 / DSM 23138 / MP5ACTX9) TaxID=1198114 RepID=E8X5T4_GRATM|nr:TonB-dependent receptor [Granulicella tundricola]ADW70818.1 TonB-dependent receptor plug [Granulicella tundricola MP5ACTX9]
MNDRLSSAKRQILLASILIGSGSSLHAATGGSVSGTVTDASGAVIPGAALTLVSVGQQTVYKTVANGQGLYSFPNLPVGHYELTISADGFTPQRKSNLTVDTDSVVRVDTELAVGNRSDSVTVTSETGIQVETSATHLGEVVTGDQMAALPLNGRSYTDLLSIQPGVAPVSTLLPNAVIMAGVTGGISPSGDENPGNVSINGQRESSNGFMVNGVDVQEHMNGGTSVVPDLDSIEQFRVLTNNFDPEYGNYNGGVVTVVTKSGGGRLHGGAFEFFRNTALDARGYFDPTRPEFKQNQFGGTLGGPVGHTKLFFFADYQGTRETQGISTGNISVPTVAERTGNFSADAAEFTTKAVVSGTSIDVPTVVSGPYLATQVLAPKLGYSVASGEPYTYRAGESMPVDANNLNAMPARYGSDCVSTTQCVFPNLSIPQSAWGAPGKSLLGFIPTPNAGDGLFSTSASTQTNRDDKGSFRLDADTRAGRISAYYFLDDYTLDNPYPGSQGGASIPGFDALTIGRAQLLSVSDTKVIGANSVNEFNLGYLRYANVVGKPQGGLGVSLASQGFTTGAGTPGIYVQAPEFEGVENVTFPSFTMGVPITNLTQVNNTYYVSDGFSRVFGAHTVKVGAQFHEEQVNEHPNATFNGTFNINGTETGSAYADLLLGTPSNYTQSSGQPFYLRNHYLGVYAQDSWRVRNDLTLNLGIRWDVVEPWSEKNHQLQTYIAGRQSVLYPGAPAGFVVAGDPGVPETIAPTSFKNFAPRIGVAYAPRFESGLGRLLFGESGKSSIRASYGIFYTAFPGLSAGIMYAVPPFGFNYLSPGPPLLATPFITAATGVNNGQRFPFPFPPHNVSTSNPDNNVDWSNFTPIAADPFFNSRNRVPYINNYMLSLQRQITRDLVFTASYVGNQGHHLLTLVSVNPGDPALCLSLPGCGAFGEDTAYTNGAGQTVRGTRVGQGSNYGENTSDSSIANSNYNALQTTLKYQHRGSSFLLSYTYGKSIDQGSNLGEQLDPVDARHSRAISAYDLRHDFVATYDLQLGVDQLVGRSNRWTKDWSLSGTTRFASGLPVTLSDNSDNSYLGTLGNGANNFLIDTPQYAPGNLQINKDGRSGRDAFRVASFQEELPGQLGNAKRRFFYGPGIDNYDASLQKGVRLRDAMTLNLRLEGFNVFNHAQFFGPAAVNGQFEDPLFGKIVSATAPRLVQVAAKLAF